mmetsp:Transcript_32113/g.72388  ORF Transcript_32113/g.72388 Transcript_32113/m.72388 type:complete len:336 (-) Transcript_32113:453-1460(-)
MEKMPNHEFTTYLKSLDVEGVDGRRIPVAYQAATPGLLELWVNDMRHGGLSGGTIRVYVGRHASMNQQHRISNCPTKDPAIRGLINKYETDDGHEESAAFDFVTDLPKMYNANFFEKGHGKGWQILFWAMFLVSICMMVRASDITDFCPTMEDILMPPEHLWDTDKLPPWIDFGLRWVATCICLIHRIAECRPNPLVYLRVFNRDWKHRSPKNKGKRYSIRVHRNKLDARFCAVFWFVKWLSFSGITSGPIFQTLDDQDKPTGKALTEDNWTTMTAHIFTKASPCCLGFCCCCGLSYLLLSLRSRCWRLFFGLIALRLHVCPFVPTPLFGGPVVN